MDTSTLFNVGLVLTIAGIIIATIGMLIALTRSKTARKTKAAGVIIIGPIPIVFGTDKKSVKIVLILALALTAALIALTILLHLMNR